MNSEHNLYGARKDAFKPYMTPLGALALAFGYAIGWGAFVMPGTTFLPLAGPLGTLIGVLGGGLAMCLIAWCYHVMVVKEPGPGGAFAFARKTFGHDHAFLVGWFLCLTYVAILWANATAMILVVRCTLGGVLQFGFHYTLAGFDVYLGEALLSMVATLLAGLVCMYHKRFAVRLQTVLAGVMIFGVLVCLVAALVRNTGGLAAIRPAFATQDGEFIQILRILAIMPWAFVGFEAITHSSAEFAFPARKTLKILLTAILLACGVYLALAFLPLLARPEGYESWPKYIADLPNLTGIKSFPVFAAAERALGPFGIALIAVTMLAAQFTGLVATFVATGRLMHAMSRADSLPGWFGELDRDATPRNAILFIMLVSLVIPFFGRTAIGWPVDASSIGATIVYAYVAATAFVDACERGSAWGKRISLAGAFLSVAFLLLLMVPNYLMGSSMAAESYLLVAIWCLMGFLVYRAAFRKDRQLRYGQSTIVWIALIVMIFFSALMWIRHMTIDVHDHVLASAIRNGASSEFLASQIDSAKDTMLRNAIVEMVLLVTALVIMLSLYSILRAKVEAMNKAKSYFFSTVSHDIRTPLNAIIGYSQMFNLGFKSPEQQSEAVGSILVSSKTLLNLINDVLDLSRLESGSMTITHEPTSCQTLLDEVVRTFKMSNTKPKLDIRFKAEGTLPTMLLDPHRLRQIAFNLVGNAVKFTQEGVIEVRAAFTPKAGSALVGTFRLDVSDTGCGISEEDMKKIASPYVQLGSKASRNGGTGLGLAICRQLAVAMGGELTAVSTLGQGSTFTVTLADVKTTTEAPSAASQPSAPPLASPAAVPPPEAASAQAPRPQAASAPRPRILIADDQKMNLMVLKALLSKLGDFDLTLAKDGKEALAILENPDTPPFDLVLTDMWMPEMNGDGLLSAIRRNPRLASLPVYVVTADVETQNTYAKSGFEGIILKPVTIDKLKEVVK